MQYFQLDETDWPNVQSLQSLQSVLLLQTVDVCILWKDSIIAERKVKQWNFPYLQKTQQNPETVKEILRFLAESANLLANRLESR